MAQDRGGTRRGSSGANEVGYTSGADLLTRTAARLREQAPEPASTVRKVRPQPRLGSPPKLTPRDVVTEREGGAVSNLLTVRGSRCGDALPRRYGAPRMVRRGELDGRLVAGRYLIDPASLPTRFVRLDSMGVAPARVLPRGDGPTAQAARRVAARLDAAEEKRAGH